MRILVRLPELRFRARPDAMSLGCDHFALLPGHGSYNLCLAYHI